MDRCLFRMTTRARSIASRTAARSSTREGKGKGLDAPCPHRSQPATTAALRPGIFGQGETGLWRGSRLFDRLHHFKAFELGMTEIQHPVLVSRVAMRGAKRLRLCPAFEGRVVRPDRVAGIQDVVFLLGSLEQMEFHESWHLLQMSITTGPEMFKRGFGPEGHLEAIHGDVHAVRSFTVTMRMAIWRTCSGKQAFRRQPSGI